MFSEIVKLPAPRYDSPTSVEAALCARRSVRDYKDLPLTLAEVSQLLWAAQGITSTRGFRTAPSAGALYPLEVYLEVGKVKELSSGIYKYELFKHELIKYLAGDKRTALANAALRQSCVKNGAVNIIFSAVYERITGKYGERGIRYVYLEAGHAAPRSKGTFILLPWQDKLGYFFLMVFTFLSNFCRGVKFNAPTHLVSFSSASPTTIKS